jgi:hypothetical protein
MEDIDGAIGRLVREMEDKEGWIIELPAESDLEFLETLKKRGAGSP